MKTDRERHGFKGLVKSVHIETASVVSQEGRNIEQPGLGYSKTFDQEGRLIEEVSRNLDGSEWRTSNEYADSDRLAARRGYDPTGALIGEVTYSYDDRGRLIEESSKAQDSGASQTTTYMYDSEGRKTKIQECCFSGEANLMISIEGTHTAVNGSQAKWLETRYDHQEAIVEVK